MNTTTPGAHAPVIGRADTPKPAALQNAFDLCVAKTRSNIRRLADEPKSAALAVDGNYFAFPEGFYEIGNWTTSFFTGMALLAWRETEDEYFLQQVAAARAALPREGFRRGIWTPITTWAF